MKLSTENNLAVKFPEIAKEWSKKNTLTAYEIVPGNNKKGLWECSKCGHEWKAGPHARTSHGNGCPACANRVATSTNNLAVKFPEIAKEWSKKNTLRAYEILPGSSKPGLWECSKCGHEWKASPNRRTCGRNNCLVCRSLAVKFPEIAKEWSAKNPKTAYEIVPGNNKKGLWECSKCGHEWKAGPHARTSQGNGCPECSKGKAERESGEDLELAFKNLKSEDFIIQGQVKINEKRRYYDFGVKKDDFVAGLLEYDGEDHYKPVRRSKNQTEETLNKKLKDCQKRDKEKTRYAKEQGIPLLRVSYKEREEQNKQIKQGIPKTETRLYKKYERFACDSINFYYSSK
jgi:Zn finger protein HypA/HybF involved in hydrogenase expression